MKQILEKFPDAVLELDFAEPAPPSEVDNVSSAIEEPIPEPLKILYSSGSAGIRCRYVLPQFGLYGGPLLMNFKDFDGERDFRYVWGVPIAAISPEAGQDWFTSRVFAVLHNGDALALKQTRSNQDGGVVYLDHEAARYRPLATSLLDFFIRWEQLFYVGPEIWELEKYIDAESGYLDPECIAAKELRQKVVNAITK